MSSKGTTCYGRILVVRLHGDLHKEMHGWSRSLSCRIVEEKIKIDMLLFQLDVYNQCL